MSPIDVDSSTIGFPFPAAVAAPGRPSPRTRVPTSAERQSVIVAVPFREREVVSSFPHAPRARKRGSVRAVPRRHGDRERRDGARQIAPHLDAAAGVDARHQAPPPPPRGGHPRRPRPPAPHPGPPPPPGRAARRPPPGPRPRGGGG